MDTNDWLILSRNGTNYKTTAQDFINLVMDNIGTTEFKEATLSDRDTNITTQSLGDRVFVEDASSDSTVDAGWAIYTWSGSAWLKVAEEEGLDVVIEQVNLGNTVTVNSIEITNSSSGTGTIIPLATTTGAGLLSPSQFDKLEFISVTGAIDLDAIKSASHPAVTTVGTSQNNPITVDPNQVIGFDIEALDILA